MRKKLTILLSLLIVGLSNLAFAGVSFDVNKPYDTELIKNLPFYLRETRQDVYDFATQEHSLLGVHKIPSTTTSGLANETPTAGRLLYNNTTGALLYGNGTGWAGTNGAINVPYASIGTYSGSLTAAVTAIGSTPTTLVIDQAATLSAATVVPSTLQLEFTGAGRVTLGNFNLTTNCVIRGPPSKIFDYTGAGVVLRGASGQDTVLADWFGAVGDNATNDRAALVNAYLYHGNYRGTVAFCQGKTYQIASSTTTIPANVDLSFLPGSKLTLVDNDLIFNGYFACQPLQQVFSLTGVGLVKRGSTGQPYIDPANFGTGTAALSAAFSYCDDNPATVVFRRGGIYGLSTSLVAGANTILQFEVGGYLTCTSPAILTINGDVVADPSYRIFYGTGSVTGLTAFKSGIASVKWFDADATAFATAVTALGSAPITLVLPVGSYTGTGVTTPATLAVKALHGAVISGDPNINGPFTGDLSQHFSGAPVFGPGSIEYARWEWWGTDAAALQAAFIACPQVRLADNATYTLNYATIGTIYLNNSGGVWRYKLIGGGNSVINLTGYTDTYAFTMNQDSGGTIISTSMTHPRFVMEDVKVDGANSTSAKFLLHNYTGIQFIRCEFRNMKQGAYSASYCDNTLLDNVVWYTPKTGGWLYENTFAGDGFTARQIQTAGSPCISLVNNQGAIIENNINGLYSFDRCGSVVFRNNHLEYGSTGHMVSIANSDIVVEGNYLKDVGGTYYPIYINDSDSYQGSKIILRNNQFPRNMESGTAPNSEIRINALRTNSILQCQNNITIPYKITVATMSPYIMTQTGILVSSAVAGISTVLGYWRSLQSGHWQLACPNASASWQLSSPPGAGVISVPYVPDPSISAIVETSSIIGNLAATTYYYRLVLYNDFNQSAHTAKSAEVSIPKAAASSTVALTVSAANNTYAYLFRGTAADTYNYYFRVPLCRGSITLYDQGTTVNTYPAEAAGAVASANNTYNGYYDIRTGLRHVWSTIATRPSTGSRAWVQGDTWSATDPASGSAADEWCTVAGGPGTWKGNALP